jgi:ABC-type multidrug transport system fused ATPase/permease subunit
MYFADELEGHLRLDIIRLGSMQGRCGCWLNTTDNSARSGDQYEKVSRQIVLEDGQYMKSVDIPLLDDDRWSATLEFNVTLAYPQNCILDPHHRVCRVLIENAQSFPSDNYKESGKKGVQAIKDENSWKLFADYCRLNFISARQQRQTLLILLLDQLHSVAIFGTLFVGVYIVDTLFARRSKDAFPLIVPGDRHATSMCIAAWYVLPVVVLWAVERTKAQIDILGCSREFLQKSLMRTCLDLTPGARNCLTIADMNVAMGINAEVVAKGYVSLLNVVGLLSRILAIGLFIIFFQHDSLAVLSVIAVVVVVITLTLFRAKYAQHAQEEIEERWLLVETLVEETHGKFRLIADYSKRALMSDMFSLAAEEYSREKVPDILLHINTQYLTKLLMGVCIANYIVHRSPAVFRGDTSLGIFLATITVFNWYLSDAITALGDEFMKIVESLVPLAEFTSWLNLELELKERRRFNRARRAHTSTMRGQMLAEDSQEPQTPSRTQTAFSDVVPIIITDLSFKYGNDYILRNVTLSIPQGQLVAVVGPHKSGKATFVQVISNILLPSHGFVYVPAHLRFLTVSREPIFLHASLMHNLALGLPEGAPIDNERIIGILKLLGLHDTIHDIEEDLDQQALEDKETRMDPTPSNRASELHDELSARGLKQSLDPSPRKSKLDADLSSRASCPTSDHTSSRGRASSVLTTQSTTDLIRDEVQFMHSSIATWEEALSFSEKVKLHLVRALIADPEVMMLDRTLQGLNKESAQEVLDVLRLHVSEKGLCHPPEELAARRPRTVFFNTSHASQTAMADCILEIEPKTQSVIMTSQEAQRWSSQKGTPRTPRGPISEGTGGT